MEEDAGKERMRLRGQGKTNAPVKPDRPSVQRKWPLSIRQRELQALGRSVPAIARNPNGRRCRPTTAVRRDENSWRGGSSFLLLHSRSISQRLPEQVHKGTAPRGR